MKMTMDRLKPGQKALVLTLRLPPSERGSLTRLGLIPGTELRCVCRSPLGDPLAYRFRDISVALRKAAAARIWVETG